MFGQRIEAAIGLHQLPEGDVEREFFLQLHRHLRERQRIQAELDEVGCAIGIGQLVARDILEHGTQALVQRVQAAGGLGRRSHGGGGF